MCSEQDILRNIGNENGNVLLPCNNWTVLKKNPFIIIRQKAPHE